MLLLIIALICIAALLAICPCIHSGKTSHKIEEAQK